MWSIIPAELFQVQCCHPTSPTLILLNLPTHCMEQSPYKEVNRWCATE